MSDLDDLIERRYLELNAWLQATREAANSGDALLVGRVFCGDCGEHLGEVVMAGPMLMLRRWDRHDLVVNSETVSPREFRSASGRTGRIGSWHGYPLTSGSRYMDLFPWRPSPEDTPHLVCAKHGRIPWPANESAQFRAAPKGSIRVRRVIVSATVE